MKSTLALRFHAALFQSSSLKTHFSNALIIQKVIIMPISFPVHVV